MTFLLRLAGAALALTIAQFAAGGIVVAIFGAAALPAPVVGSMPWQIVQNVLVAAVLAWIGVRSSTGRWRLAGTLGLLYFGIIHFNSLIEAMFFRFVTPRLFGVLIFMTLLVAAFLVLALRMVFAGTTAAQTVRDWMPRLTAGRFAGGAIAYLIIYFVAGMSIYPFISHFYEQQTPPPGLQIIAMQLLVRGPLFVALAAMIVSISGARRSETILMIAAAMSVIGGLAPLIVPNSLMPDSIRWYHLIEVTTSNFLFGGFLGWILTTAAADRTPAATAAFGPPDRVAR